MGPKAAVENKLKEINVHPCQELRANLPVQFKISHYTDLATKRDTVYIISTDI